MTNGNLIDLSKIGNTTELCQFDKFENGYMTTYGYSIERNTDGIEVSRTEPSALSSIGWSNGRPFTKDDCFKLEK